MRRQRMNRSLGFARDDEELGTGVAWWAFDADAVIWNLDKIFNKDSAQFDTRQSVQVRPRLPSLASYRKAGDMAVELKTKAVDSLFVRRRAEHAHPAVVLDPAQLVVVRDVAPHQELADRAPGRPLRPPRPGPQPLDRGVALGEGVERRVDGDDVGVAAVDRRRTARAEVARRRGDHAGRRGHGRRRLRSYDGRDERGGPDAGRDQAAPRQIALACLLRHECLSRNSSWRYVRLLRTPRA